MCSENLVKDRTIHISGPNVLAMIRVDHSFSLESQIEELLITLSEMTDYGREQFEVKVTDGWSV